MKYKRVRMAFSEKEEKIIDEVMDQTVFTSYKELFLHYVQTAANKLNPGYVQVKRDELDIRKKKMGADGDDIDFIYNQLESFILPEGFAPSQVVNITRIKQKEEVIETIDWYDWEDNGITFPLLEPMIVMNAGWPGKNNFYPISRARHIDKKEIDFHKLNIKKSVYNNQAIPAGETTNKGYWVWKMIRDAGYTYDDAKDLFGE